MLPFQYTEEANEFLQVVTDIDERSSFVIRKVCAKLDHSKITKPELVETIFRLVKGLIQDNEVIPIQSASTDISPADSEDEDDYVLYEEFDESVYVRKSELIARGIELPVREPHFTSLTTPDPVDLAEAKMRLGQGESLDQLTHRQRHSYNLEQSLAAGGKNQEEPKSSPLVNDRELSKETAIEQPIQHIDTKTDQHEDEAEDFVDAVEQIKSPDTQGQAGDAAQGLPGETDEAKGAGGEQGEVLAEVSDQDSTNKVDNVKNDDKVDNVTNDDNVKNDNIDVKDDAATAADEVTNSGAATKAVQAEEGIAAKESDKAGAAVKDNTATNDGAKKVNDVRDPTPAVVNTQTKKICFKLKVGRCKFGISGVNRVTGKKCPFEHPKKCNKWAKAGWLGEGGCKANPCDKLHQTICQNVTPKGKMCTNESCTFLHPSGWRNPAAKPEASKGARSSGDPTPNGGKQAGALGTAANNSGNIANKNGNVVVNNRLAKVAEVKENNQGRKAKRGGGGARLQGGEGQHQAGGGQHQGGAGAGHRGGGQHQSGGGHHQEGASRQGGVSQHHAGGGQQQGKAALHGVGQHQGGTGAGHRGGGQHQSGGGHHQEGASRQGGVSQHHAGGGQQQGKAALHGVGQHQGGTGAGHRGGGQHQSGGGHHQEGAGHQGGVSQHHAGGDQHTGGQHEQHQDGRASYSAVAGGVAPGFQGPVQGQGMSPMNPLQQSFLDKRLAEMHQSIIQQMQIMLMTILRPIPQVSPNLSHLQQGQQITQPTFQC